MICVSKETEYGTDWQWEDVEKWIVDYKVSYALEDAEGYEGEEVELTVDRGWEEDIHEIANNPKLCWLTVTGRAEVGDRDGNEIWTAEEERERDADGWLWGKRPKGK